MMEELLQQIKPLGCLVSVDQRLGVIYRGQSYPTGKMNLSLQKLCLEGEAEAEMGGAVMLWLFVIATKQIYCPTKLPVAPCWSLAMTGRAQGSLG